VFNQPDIPTDFAECKGPAHYRAGVSRS
jgi:hypothetical protein